MAVTLHGEPFSDTISSIFHATIDTLAPYTMHMVGPYKTVIRKISSNLRDVRTYPICSQRTKEMCHEWAKSETSFAREKIAGEEYVSMREQVCVCWDFEKGV